MPKNKFVIITGFTILAIVTTVIVVYFTYLSTSLNKQCNLFSKPKITCPIGLTCWVAGYYPDVNGYPLGKCKPVWKKWQWKKHEVNEENEVKMHKSNLFK